MRCMCLLEAGRFSEDRVFTEKDWSLEKEGTVYEKSKHRAEKAAWELVKNLPGIELVHGPESETLPLPPRGFLQTGIISKLHPRVFEKCMFALDWLVGVAVQQHSFPQQRVTGYPHQEVS